jgi:hypothetical protein
MPLRKSRRLTVTLRKADAEGKITPFARKAQARQKYEAGRFS